jgi:polyphosphate kinase 2
MRAEVEPVPPIRKRDYERELVRLQIELVKLQRHIIHRGYKILVLFEGRDAAGKDGTIKHIVEHLSPRETRVVALGKPSEHEASSWYFQRYAVHLPAAQEFVLFNRSWYNRAGVERVMNFCTPEQTEEFLEVVPEFEAMLKRSGIQLFKYYLDITRNEQACRLRDRKKDPLKQWKVSPIDEVALEHWDDYTRARNTMLARTHTKSIPWIVVRADDKHQARLNVIRDLLSRVECQELDSRLGRPDRRIVREYERELVRKHWLSP